MKSFLLICITLTLGNLSSIGSADDPSTASNEKGQTGKSVVAKSPKFETPEACFRALIVERNSKDPVTIFPCMSEAYVNYTVGQTAFELERLAFIRDGGEPCKECMGLLKKYKLYGKDLMGFLQDTDSPTPGGATAGFMQIGDSFEDKPTFMREATAAIIKANLHFKKLRVEEQPEEEKSDSTKPEEQEVPKFEFNILKMDEDSASAELQFDGKDEKPTLFFKKQNGSWVIALGPNEPDFRKPIRGLFLFSNIKEVTSKEIKDDENK